MLSINSLQPSLLSDCAARLPYGVDRRVPRGLKNPLCFKLSERFGRVRSASALTLVHVGSVAGVAQPVPGRIERGQGLTALDTLERLAAALGVSPGWLAYGYEGSEPFRERYPRPIFDPVDPTPDDNLRAFRALHEGFPARLQQSRERSGLSMRTLSTAAGVSVQAWSNSEAGKVVPRVDTAERMAVALGVAPSWLAFGEGPGPN